MIAGNSGGTRLSGLGRLIFREDRGREALSMRVDIHITDEEGITEQVCKQRRGLSDVANMQAFDVYNQKINLMERRCRKQIRTMSPRDTMVYPWK